MAGFLNFAVPAAEIGGGGIGEFTAARERAQKRLQEQAGYRAGIESLVKQDPQLRYLADAVAAGAPADKIFGVAPELLKSKSASPQERASFYFSQAETETDPAKKLVWQQAGMAAAKGDSALADKLLTHGGMLGAPARPTSNAEQWWLQNIKGLTLDAFATLPKTQREALDAEFNLRKPQIRPVLRMDADGNAHVDYVQIGGPPATPAGGPLAGVPSGPISPDEANATNRVRTLLKKSGVSDKQIGEVLQGMGLREAPSGGSAPPSASTGTAPATVPGAPPVRTLFTVRKPDEQTLKGIQSFNKALSDLDAAEDALRTVGRDQWNAGHKKYGAAVKRGFRYGAGKLGMSSGDPNLDRALDAVSSAQVSATGAITSGTNLRSARIVEGLTLHVPKAYSDYDKLMTDIEQLRDRFQRGVKTLQTGEPGPVTTGGGTSSDDDILRRAGFGR